MREGATLRCDSFERALLVSRGVSLACWRATSFSLLAHVRARSANEQRSWPEGRRAGSPESREEGKRKGTPDGTLVAHPWATSTRSGYGVFRQHILCWRKTGSHPCDPAYGLSSTRPPRQTGARVKAARSSAQKQRQRQLQEQNATTSCISFASARRSAPLLSGPLCGGEVWTTRPVGASTGSRCLFARAGALSKSPVTPHGLSRHGWLESDKRGVLSLGYFSLSTQRKVTRAAVAARKPAAGEHTGHTASIRSKVACTHLIQAQCAQRESSP